MIQQTKWPPPYQFRDRVCSCKGPTPSKVHKNGFSASCALCGKYHRYVVYHCSICREPYLQTYTSPYRCVQDSRCPSHLRNERCDHTDCRKFFDQQELFIREEDVTPLPAPTLDTLEEFTFDFNF